MDNKEINGQCLQQLSDKQTENVLDNDLDDDSSNDKNQVSDMGEMGIADGEKTQDENVLDNDRDDDSSNNKNQVSDMGEMGIADGEKRQDENVLDNDRDDDSSNKTNQVSDMSEMGIADGEKRQDENVLENDQEEDLSYKTSQVSETQQMCIAAGEEKHEEHVLENNQESNLSYKTNQVSETRQLGIADEKNTIKQNDNEHGEKLENQSFKDDPLLGENGEKRNDGDEEIDNKDGYFQNGEHRSKDDHSDEKTKSKIVTENSVQNNDGSNQQESKDNDMRQEGPSQDGSIQQESKDDTSHQESMDNGSDQGRYTQDGSSHQESKEDAISQQKPKDSSHQQSKQDGSCQQELKQDDSNHQESKDNDSIQQESKYNDMSQEGPSQDGKRQQESNDDSSQQQPNEKNISSIKQVPKQNGSSQQSKKFETENGKKMKESDEKVSLEEDENDESYDKLECSCRLRDKTSKIWFCQHCDIIVCNKCGYSHTHHALCDIKEMTKLKKNNIYHFLIQTQEKLQVHREAINDVRENKKNYTDQMKQYIDEIQKQNEKVKAAVDMVTNQMIQSLQTQGETDQQALEQKEGILDIEAEKLQENIKMCEEIISSKNISKILKFESQVTKQKSHILPAQKSIPVNPPVFIEGEIYPNVIKCLIGCFDYSECQSEEPVVNLKNSKIIDAVVISSFQPKLSYNLIATGNGEGAWLGYIGRSDISMVTEKGKFGKTTKLGSIFNQIDIIDMAMTGEEELLFTIYDGNIIKKLSKNDKFEDFADMTPYSTRGITVTEEEDILICLYQNGDGKINRLTSTGHTVETIQHGYDGRPLFKEPLNVHQNKNGNLCIIQYDDSCNSKNLLVVDKAGQLRFTYDGPEAVTLDKAFYPWYVVTDKCSNIIISDQLNCSVHLLDENGTFLKFLFTWREGLDWPQGLSIGKNGHLWICSNDRYQKSKVYVVKYLE